MFDGLGRKDALNAVSGFFAGYGWVSFACFFYLVITWASAAPHEPDPAHGLIYPHNEHGTITYFSGFQGTSCALLFATSPLFFFLAVSLSPKKNVALKTGRLGFGMKWEPDDPTKIQHFSMIAGAFTALPVVFLLGPSLVTALNSLGIVTGF